MSGPVSDGKSATLAILLTGVKKFNTGQPGPRGTHSRAGGVPRWGRQPGRGPEKTGAGPPGRGGDCDAVNCPKCKDRLYKAYFRQEQPCYRCMECETIYELREIGHPSPVDIPTFEKEAVKI